MGNTADHLEHTENIFDIDFILAYNNEKNNSEQLEKRQVFEANLKSEGLKLEYDTRQQVHFIKVRAPKRVITHYAEILRFQFPLKPIPGRELVYEKGATTMLMLEPCFSQKQNFPLEPRIFHAFSRHRAQLFDLDDPIFFNAALRNSIVYFILKQQHFVKENRSPLNMGIEKLLHDHIYLSAYPLHNDSERKWLLERWASLKRCISPQPLFAIYQYFGARVALYFAWLGYYIAMLAPLSFFGLVCLFYGLITLPRDSISYNICRRNATILMCPQCDRNCDYWELKSTCTYANINYLLDNELTVFYALVMSVWSIFYLEFWKRYSAGLVHAWGLTKFSQQVEHPRPQYLAKLYEKRALTVLLNAENHTYEPVVPFWRLKFLPSFASYSVLVLFICVSLITMFALIVYRMAQAATHSLFDEAHLIARKIFVMPITAGLLNLFAITLLNILYAWLALLLTDLEYHRTQTEYEESLTIKNYIFQFVNYYASLFYIAFIKNKFIGYPGKYNRIWNYRQEECHPAGCLIELCIQLVIIKVGKQAFKSVIKMLLPHVMKFLRLLCLRKKNAKVSVTVDNSPWTRDYNLQKFTSETFYKEYLEMVMQFGFVVLFGLAFPLAPLLALVYNIFELRLVARKFLRRMQRPIARRENNIGVWYNIMQILISISVLVNAVIIAFSTNFIPKIVYTLKTGDRNLQGFLDFSLARFNTKDFEVKPVIEHSRFGDVAMCCYFDYRNTPEHKMSYGRTVEFWYILVGRFAFIVLYQNVIWFLQNLVAWAISDAPKSLLNLIRREDYLAREHIINFERKNAIFSMST